MLKKSSHRFLMFIVLFDLIIIILTFLISRYLTGFDLFRWKINEAIASFIIICVLYIALEKFEFSHYYRSMPFYIIVKKVISFELFLLSIFYLTKIFNKIIRFYDFHNTFIIYYSFISFIALLIIRAFFKLFLTLLRNRGYDFKNYLIIGAGETGLDFYKTVVTSNDLGIRIIGFLDDDKIKIKFKDLFQYKSNINRMYNMKSLILGSLNKLENILKSKDIDNIIVALPMKYIDKIISIFSVCSKYGVKAELIPRYPEIFSDNPSVRVLKKFTLIGSHNVPLENMFNRFIKRLVDIIGSVIGLILFSPLFVIIGIIMKILSRGPIFFSQKRTGYSQKVFNIIKFRTMRMNIDAHVKQATENDPRKTKFGDFLRKTNLDELPQLINILKGDMSIVGPRPHMIHQTEEFNKKYNKYLIRHWVKPGLTGWAQVNGWRGATDIGMRIKYDLEYIENWSLFFDLKIFFLTFFGKKVKRNAY